MKCIELVFMIALKLHLLPVSGSVWFLIKNNVSSWQSAGRNIEGRCQQRQWEGLVRNHVCMPRRAFLVWILS